MGFITAVQRFEQQPEVHEVNPYVPICINNVKVYRNASIAISHTGTQQYLYIYTAAYIQNTIARAQHTWSYIQYTHMTYAYEII